MVMQNRFKTYYYILIPILFFLIFPPDPILRKIPGSIKTISRLAALCIVFLFFVKQFLYEKRVSKLLIGYGIFWVYTVIITVIKHNYIASAFYNMGILSFGMMMLFEVFCREDKQKFYITLYITIYIMVVINLITYKMYPREYSESKYFFGNTNAWFNYYFPIITIGYIFFLNERKNQLFNLSYVVLIAIVLITSILNRSATTLVVMSFLIIYALIFNKEQFRYLFNGINYIIVNIGVFFLIVFPGSNGNSLAAIVAKLLNKSVSFTGRTPLWDKAKVIIREELLTGYGAYRGGELADLLDAGGLSHFHNMYFTEAYIGGIIGLTLFLILFLVVGIRVYKIKNYSVKGFLLAVLFVVCLRGQMESNLHLTIILALSMAYYFEDMYIDQTNFISLEALFNIWKKKD